MMKKAQNIKKGEENNFLYAKKKKTTKKRYYSIVNEMHLQNKIIFYHAKGDRSPCNEKELLSSMLGIDAPCCHRVKLGAVFPPCPTMRLALAK